MLTGLVVFVCQLGASDPDSGVNGQLDYSLLSVTPAVSANFFRIDNNGGVILQGQVSAGEVYNLMTRVSDRGTPSLS